jgi:flagellar biogenesis protein FliO
VQGLDVQLWRLTWALPLVIAVGWALILLLKRLGLGAPGELRDEVEDTVLVSSQALTDQTRVLLVRVQGQSYVVFESAAHLSVQAIPSQTSVSSLSFAQPSPVSFSWRRWRRTP